MLRLACLACWGAWLCAAEPPPTPNVVTNNTAQEFAVRPVGSNVFQLGAIRLDRARRAVRFPAVLNLDAGLIEYLVVTTQGKIHESLLRTEVSPRQLHVAMLLLGAQGAGTNAFPTDPTQPLPGDRVIVELIWTEGGQEKRVRAEDTLRERRTGASVSRGPWIYTGSRVVEGVFVAQELGSIVALIEDPDALINNPRPRRDDDENWEIKPKSLPPLESSVEVEIRLEPPPPQRSPPRRPEDKPTGPWPRS